MLPNLSDRTRLLLELDKPPSEGMDKEAAVRTLRDHRLIYKALQKGDQETAVKELHHQLIRGRELLVEQMSKNNE